jgi:hypothetical protein
MRKLNDEKEQPTPKQKAVLESHIDKRYNTFKCPSCKSEWQTYRVRVENPGEDETQVYCLYGCGFIFLNKKKLI